MNRTEKIAAVDEIKESLSKAASVVIANYRGLTVEQVNGIRKEIRAASCHYRVLKNTLVKRAIAGTPMEVIAPLLKGPTALAYSDEDPAAAAKILDKFAESLEKLELKGGFIDGQVLNRAGVKQLANMKSKDQLRAEFLALLNAPAQGFLRVLTAGPTTFVYLMKARERALENS